jgi:hypothetical protein
MAHLRRITRSMTKLYTKSVCCSGRVGCRAVFAVPNVSGPPGSTADSGLCAGAGVCQCRITSKASAATISPNQASHAPTTRSRDQEASRRNQTPALESGALYARTTVPGTASPVGAVTRPYTRAVGGTGGQAQTSVLHRETARVAARRVRNRVSFMLILTSRVTPQRPQT